MIEFPRSLARQLWDVFRRCVPRAQGARTAAIEFRTDGDGLAVRLSQPEIAVEYRQSGSYPAENLRLPLSALSDFEGRGQDLVTLEAGKDGLVGAHWQDGSVPQVVEYEIASCAGPANWPELPPQLVRNPPALLQALEEASKTAADDAARFALNRLQLRGRAGDVVATDSKQLLLQGGFQFPWQEDVLIPAAAAFGCRSLPADAAVEVGKAEQQVVLRVGAWTFFLRCDAEARYPNVENVIPKQRERTTQLRIAPEDAAFLARALPRLPCPNDDDTRPLTVDLGDQVCLRTCGASPNRITEVVLARSAFKGQPVRFCINRQFLGRLLHLGFDEIRILDADSPMLAQDNQRTYVLMPLSKALALAPAADALRIVSAEEQRPAQGTATERKKPFMTTPSTNGNGTGNGTGHRADPPAPEPGGTGMGSLIAEAQALKDALHETYGRANRLVTALRRNRKQSKLVAATLAGLKQLQQIES